LFPLCLLLAFSAYQVPSSPSLLNTLFFLVAPILFTFVLCRHFSF
jgi:hypothetical protein